MTRLSDAIAGLPVKPPKELLTGDPTGSDTDYCGCPKTAGCWGDFGQHWRRYGEAEIAAEVSRALGVLPQGSDDNTRRQVERTTREWARIYIGRAIRYEQCPAAAAAIQREIDERKGKQQSGGTGLVDGLDRPTQGGDEPWPRRTRRR